MRTLLLKRLLFTMSIFAGLGVFVTLVAFSASQMAVGNNVPILVLIGFISIVCIFMLCFLPNALVPYPSTEKRIRDMRDWIARPHSVKRR